MKKILITGAGSYVGESVKVFLLQWPEQYQVDTVHTKTKEWSQLSFDGYDSVFHVAGIAHIKETRENRDLYYKVNRDMAVEIAQKAKESGVAQFIFMSTMSVYGMETGVITKDTPTNPKNSYADSKLQAERFINNLADECFKICILRPPMIYGKGCKGNFQSVIKIVKKSPVFPKVRNQRSLIYIDNFSSFVKKVIDENLEGLYFPQNKEYMNTTQMATWIAEKLGKKEFISVTAGVGIKCIQPVVGLAKKAFGTLIYKDTEDFNFDYCSVDLEKSIKRSV